MSLMKGVVMTWFLNRVRNMRQRWQVVEMVEHGGFLVVYAGTLRSCKQFLKQSAGGLSIVHRSTWRLR